MKKFKQGKDFWRGEVGSVSSGEELNSLLVWNII